MSATGLKTTAADAPQRPAIPEILRIVGLTPEQVRVAAFRSRIRRDARMAAEAKAQISTAAD